MSRMLGDVEKSVSENSITYSAKFLVFKDEVNSFEPEIKDSVDWTPEKCLVTSFSKTKNGPHWIYSISAIPKQEGQITFNTSDPNEFVLKEYEMCDFYFHEDFWGARQASSSDVKENILNIEGETAQRGDYVFGNATSSSAGSANYANSPFQGTSISTELIGQTVKTMVYCCTFYSRQNVNHFVDFSGVNGSFSVKCRPSKTSSGYWKSESQSLSNTQGKDGKVWARITRKMLLAPVGLKWDPNKNGGTWKW